MCSLTHHEEKKKNLHWNCCLKLQPSCGVLNHYREETPVSSKILKTTRWFVLQSFPSTHLVSFTSNTHQTWQQNLIIEWLFKKEKLNPDQITDFLFLTILKNRNQISLSHISKPISKQQATNNEGSVTWCQVYKTEA